jgi:ferredoxin
MSDTLLRVNPIRCDGHGLCAELFPERISLDEWGYPIIDGRPLSRALEVHARRAVDACPVLALRLERTRKPPP